MKKSKKRRQLTNKRKRFLITNAFLVLFLFVGIGYSALNANLNIFGDVTVKEHLEPTVANTMKEWTGGANPLVKEYTGEHQDSPEATGTKKIYYWDAKTNEELNEIQNKNNVIFANLCWKTYRTTDTGGVKLVYNGEPENNQCSNSRETHVGYSGETTTELLSEYYYGTDYTFDNNSNQFSISGNITTGEPKIGTYTCQQTSPENQCSILYYVDKIKNGSTYYVIRIRNNSRYDTIGSLQYNYPNSFMNSVGYMNNKSYSHHYWNTKQSEEVYSSRTLSLSYWYADDISWDSSINKWTLVNPYQITSTDEYVNLAGKYSFFSSNEDYSQSSVSYIVNVSGSTAYYVFMRDGNNLDYYNKDYVYGDGYTINNDGTAKLTSTHTIKLLDYYLNYSDMNDKYMCSNGTVDSCNQMRHVKTYNSSFSYYQVMKFSSDYSYVDGKYVLTGDSIYVEYYYYYDTNFKDNISSHHYTCRNLIGECDSLAYSLGYNTSNNFYYFELHDGNGTDKYLNDMLYADDVNKNDSLMKIALEKWYEKYMIEYNQYLEDVVFCYDRSPSGIDTNAWNPNGGQFGNSYSYFGSQNLACPNVTDQFSTSNEKAKTQYPIGMFTNREYKLSTITIFGNGVYWIASPCTTESSGVSRMFCNLGGFSNCLTTDSNGVRPVVSLKGDVKYSAGDGSVEHPYYVGEAYNINTESTPINIISNAVAGWNITISDDNYIVTSFKMNGEVIEGDTFTMPAEDVTITDIQYIIANYSIINTDSDIIVPNTGRYGKTITLESNDYKVVSFKLNGELIEGNSFVMPAEDVTITDVVKIPVVTVESEHNPYANNINNVTYYENTFEGATSITVEFTYQTESTTYDWIYLYDTEGSTTSFNNKKYGGTTKKTETLTIPSNYLKIVFRTDGSGNNYYGFKAVITPNYE